jgi:type VI secretion system protein ImpM
MRRGAGISAPAIFGKLPDQRDYVRWRVSAEEGQVWQSWLNSQTWVGHGRHIVPPEGRTDFSAKGDGWMRLSPHETPKQELHHPLPWSFVLAPGFLSVGGWEEWLTGTLVASRDSVGRTWPLVIYQRASREWLEEALPESQGWLYWLAKMAAQHTSPLVERHGQLVVQTDLLWDMWRPGPRWTRWLRGLRRAHQRSQSLTTLPDLPTVDLPGVRYLPWVGWPEKILAPSQSGQGWFWQQNNEGRYVDALRLVGKQ